MTKLNGTELKGKEWKGTELNGTLLNSTQLNWLSVWSTMVLIDRHSKAKGLRNMANGCPLGLWLLSWSNRKHYGYCWQYIWVPLACVHTRIAKEAEKWEISTHQHRSRGYVMQRN